MEKEKAKDAGIYENKPDVRRDVYREDDDQLEMIPAQKAKSLKQLWMKMGEETPKETGVPKVLMFAINMRYFIKFTNLLQLSFRWFHCNQVSVTNDKLVMLRVYNASIKQNCKKLN